MSFTKEKDFDEYEYNLAKDIKNELSLEEIATIRNNLQLNNAKGLGVTYVPDKIVTVYAKGYNDFKVLDYNEIDDARTIGTISRQNEGAINTDTLANDGSFGDVGLTNSLYEDDKLVGGKQGTGLRFDGFSESSNTNQGGITRSNPLTDNQYNDMVKKYMEKNGKTRFSLDEQTQLHKDRAIEEYGITNNPMLAEYLMDDGKFLDFSERQN